MGCKHKNLLLAAWSFSGLWGYVRNFMLYYFVWLQTKQSFISIVTIYYRPSLLQTLNLPPPPMVSTVTGVDCTWKSNNWHNCQKNLRAFYLLPKNFSFHLSLASGSLFTHFSFPEISHCCVLLPVFFLWPAVDGTVESEVPKGKV